MITLARMLSISRRFHRQHYHLQRSSLQCYSSAIMSTPMKATIKVDVVSDTVCPWWVPAAWLENGCVVCIVSLWCPRGAHELPHVSIMCPWALEAIPAQPALASPRYIAA